MKHNHDTKAVINKANTGAMNVTAMDEYNNFAIQVSWTDETAVADNSLAGVAQVNNLTFEAQASMVDGEYVVVYDTAGLAWAIAADLTGTSVEPTGAIWVAIPAAQKAQVDLSGATDAISVAAAFEVEFDGLASVPFATDDTAANGTMLFTQNVRGVITDPASLLEDDAGVGGVGIAEPTAGVDSGIDVTADAIEMVAHGLVLGVKGQMSTTATLPGGLAITTDYWVIVIDADNIQLASSLANAETGTQIDITDQGTSGATHTFTPTALASSTIKVQETVDNINWYDISGVVTAGFTADGAALLQGTTRGSGIRTYLTITAGQVAVTEVFFTREE